MGQRSRSIDLDDRAETSRASHRSDYGISAKWLELIKELAPRAARFAVLREAGSLAGIGLWAAMQGVAPSFRGRIASNRGARRARYRAWRRGFCPRAYWRIDCHGKPSHDLAS